MDRSNDVRLTPSELTPAVLEGAAIYGADDHQVGKIEHIQGEGAGGSAVIDVGIPWNWRQAGRSADHGSGVYAR